MIAISGRRVADAAALVARMAEERDAHLRSGNYFLGHQVGTWLFGVQLALEAMGLKELAKLAIAAQQEPPDLMQEPAAAIDGVVDIVRGRS